MILVRYNLPELGLYIKPHIINLRELAALERSRAQPSTVSQTTSSPWSIMWVVTLVGEL